MPTYQCVYGKNCTNTAHFRIRRPEPPNGTVYWVCGECYDKAMKRSDLVDADLNPEIPWKHQAESDAGIDPLYWKD